MYASVMPYVKLSSSMSLSDFIIVTLCLKTLSHILFILVVNDINDSIDFNSLTEKQLSMYLFLFTEDIVVFTTDHHSLQAQLDSIFNYSLTWGLKINVNKTKGCIFEKRKQLHNLQWVINGEPFEVVDHFCYLG